MGHVYSISFVSEPRAEECPRAAGAAPRNFPGSAVNFAAQPSEPVSYTHLDVYKRQANYRFVVVILRAGAVRGWLGCFFGLSHRSMDRRRRTIGTNPAERCGEQSQPCASAREKYSDSIHRVFALTANIIALNTAFTNRTAGSGVAMLPPPLKLRFEKRRNGARGSMLLVARFSDPAITSMNRARHLDRSAISAPHRDRHSRFGANRSSSQSAPFAKRHSCNNMISKREPGGWATHLLYSRLRVAFRTKTIRGAK